MQGGHDPALADNVCRSGDAGAGRREAEHVTRRPIAVFDCDEVREAGMSFRDWLDCCHAQVGAAELFAALGLEVLPDLICHSRCAVSPSAPTMRRLPTALTTLMLVK